MAIFKLPDDFLLGTVTSSVQIEGGDTGNTWYQWAKDGHIVDNSSPFTACDHWNKVEEDTRILKSLHVQTHRMSLEWSRLEPAPGQFSAAALQHYREEIQRLLDENIEPLVTLHHFSEPVWFQEAGGWQREGNAQYFIAYVRYVVENLGDLVCEWVTFNEPNVYTLFGYEIGSFPPGIRNLRISRQVKAELIKTHVHLYTLIHQIRRDRQFPGRTRVGAAMHLRVFDGLTFFGKMVARLADHIFNELCLAGMTTGRLKFPLPGWPSSHKKGRYADFLGINYYTRNIVEFAWDPRLYFYRWLNDKSLDKSDLGWDIYPQGIYRVCKKYYSRYKLPIYITENGISDKHDNRRPDYLVRHLAWLAKAVSAGIKVERYYHWTLMDNFEWLEGETAKFGLYHCNFRTQERTARKSAELFRAVCMTKEFTAEIGG
ncbi:MAG: glycoside hydrolase family 1 protein [Clostridia bacterium]|jgi:beta-glucosidase|nr:glycoside hydrolase family 1 protein [Clostridia bacterium]